MYVRRNKAWVLKLTIIFMFYTCVLYISLPEIFANIQTRQTANNKSHPKKFYQSTRTKRCLTKMSNDTCKTCLNGWSGKDCGIPPHPNLVTVTERDEPCYIVQATIVNHEIDMLKLKIDNSLPYTDEFIVIEADKTFALEPKIFYVKDHEKELSSLVKLRQHHVHIKTRNKYSWDVQNEMRLGNITFHNLYKDIPLNSLVIFTDLDEIVRPEVLHFLKYYNCSPYPTGVAWDTFLFGFFFFDSFVTRPSSFGTIFKSPLDIRHQPKTWTIPRGGWHCRWCFKIEDIQMKLKSSPYVDLPRIADKPEKMKSNVIYEHVINGKWFLGKKRIPRMEPQDIPMNTPIYMRSYDWWIKHPPNKTA
ncbi:beta-1,4-mannosyl-glycoprotein 4-beta-N-acetylglucosaminyltransferase-like [Mytilus trossulus]|uniref:beta-1,4-mannosyl-glycoprotein 4-beta-N-acetylglucosaminyltransferase-like n=1 Tax=Mytilus trossulus TaxID=6551 RepID=UPI003006CA33